MMKLVIYLLVLFFLPTTFALAKPTTPEQAQRVVINWLSLDNRPLGASIGDMIKEVKGFPDSYGPPLYYIVYLNPNGFVIVSGDDLVEPIVGFIPEGQYDPSPDNLLGALVSRDLPGRVFRVREILAKAQDRKLEFIPMGLLGEAQRKWDNLLNKASGELKNDYTLRNISDIRVPPLIQSKWGQTTDTDGGQICYNYFTPFHYPSGCTATAMAQLMRYYNYPNAPKGTTPLPIYVNNEPHTENLRGGDGSGGPYDWANMELVPADPNITLTDTQRQAIGSLTHDAGVSAKTSYSPNVSGAWLSDAGMALVETFRYSNVKHGFNSWENLPGSNLNSVHPEMDIFKRMYLE